MTLKIHLSRILVDPIPDFHEMYRIINKRSWNTSSNGHISCVQVHVTTLDAFDAQGSQGGKILCKAYAQHYLGQFLSVWELQYFECV